MNPAAADVVRACTPRPPPEPNVAARISVQAGTADKRSRTAIREARKRSS
jgi:hypothetical protein